MSKSLGNVFCPLKTAEITSVDGLRYFLLKQIPYEHGGWLIFYFQISTYFEFI